MRKFIFITFISVSVNLLHAQTKNFIDQPYLETNATYTTEVVPDQIYLTIFISEKDTKGKIAVEDLERKMVVQLESLGIDVKKQLSVQDLTSNFKTYLLKKRDVLKNKSYRLLLYDAKTTGRVILSLEKINIANIEIDKVLYSKLEALKIELKGKAILKAKKQAEVMLTPLNQKLGKAIYISDANTDISNVLSGKVMGINSPSIFNESYAKNKFADLEFDNIRVSSTVSVRFTIE